MKEEEEIDSVVRSKLIDYEELPSSAVWDGINSNLNSGRKRFPFFMWLIAGVVLGGIAVSLFYELHEQPTYNPRQNSFSSPDFSENDEETTKESVIAEPESVLSEVSARSASPVQPVTPVEPIALDVSSQAMAESSNMTRKSKAEDSSIENLRMSNPAESESNLSTHYQSQDESKSVFELDGLQGIHSIGLREFELDFSSELWDSNTQDLPLLKRGIWYVGAFYSYDMNNRNSEAKGTLPAYRDSLTITEENANHHGGGLFLSHRTNSGWRFTTSISYGKWCQSTAYNLKIYNQYETTGNPIETIETGVITSTGNGNIFVDYEDLPFLPSTSLSPDVYSLSYRVEECYSRLSIPLEIGYELNFGRFNLVPEISAGYAYFFNYQRSETASAELPSLRFEKTSDFNQNTLYWGFGGQIEYSLTDRWSIGIGYVNKQWITPLFENDSFETSPRIQSAQAQFLYRL